MAKQFPRMNESLRSTASATTPGRHLDNTMPAVNAPVTIKASGMLNPASRRNRVLTPQINDAVSVWRSTRLRGVGLTRLGS